MSFHNYCLIFFIFLLGMLELVRKFSKSSNEFVILKELRSNTYYVITSGEKEWNRERRVFCFFHSSCTT